MSIEKEIYKEFPKDLTNYHIIYRFHSLQTWLLCPISRSASVAKHAFALEENTFSFTAHIYKMASINALRSLRISETVRRVSSIVYLGWTSKRPSICLKLNWFLYSNLIIYGILALSSIAQLSWNGLSVLSQLLTSYLSWTDHKSWRIKFHRIIQHWKMEMVRLKKKTSKWHLVD